MTAVSDVPDEAPEERVYSYPGEVEEAEPPVPADDFDFSSLSSPEVDRSTAARELAGLFDDLDAAGTPRHGTSLVAAPPAPPRPRRLEDDDQVTRGLISRLIDGVKGL